jgi:hypothetical protein
MKKVQWNTSEKVTTVTNTQARLYQEMHIATPIFNKDEKETFLSNIDNDLSIEVWEERMLPEDQDYDEEADWREWYEKYQKKHYLKYGKYLYI